jgi:hypothetical protein
VCNGFAIDRADSVDRACVIAPQSMGSSFWSGLACHSWSIAAGSSSARGPRCRISFFVWVSAAPEPPLFGTARAVETSCADSGATVNAFSGAAPCCRVFDRGGRGRTRVSLPPALPRRPALGGRSFPNQRNRSAKVGFVDLGGVGLDLEGKISYGHLGTIQAGDGEMTPDVIALSRVRNTSMVEEKANHLAASGPPAV